jgi:glycosyltransferase involved in cell wall biosynthesis
MSAPRLLVLGWLNGPHVALWVDAMAARGWEVHLAGELEPALPVAFPAGAAEVHELPRRGVPGLRAAAAVPWVRRLARRVAPRVVHAHWLPSFGWMAARARVAPLVVSAWGSDVYRVNGAVRRRSGVAVAGADLLFADSEDLLAAAAALSRTPVRGEVVRWGVDVGRFSPADADERRAIRARLGLPDGDTVLGIRSLDPADIYNTPALLEAFAAVRAQRPGATLVLKHPRSEAPPEVAQALDRLGIAAATRIIGNVPVDELADFYRAADVCVSIPSTDSSPISVWEAMACGSPIVVSDLPWARAELRAGEDALLAPAEPGAVAEAMLAPLQDPALGERLRAAARALAVERMDQAAHMDRADRLYRELSA